MFETIPSLILCWYHNQLIARVEFREANKIMAVPDFLTSEWFWFVTL